MSSYHYNDDLRKHLKKPSEIPSTPHYAILIFEDRTYCEAGWDANDPPTTGTYSAANYYAFEDQQLAEKVVKDLYQENQHNLPTHKETIVFFKSSGKAVVDISFKIGFK